MPVETVAVTGGVGTVGSAVVSECNDAGYRTVAVDVERGQTTADEFVHADLTDPGDTYGALAVHDADAVIHLGTIPNRGGHPETTVFESNATTAYNVLQAAADLGIERVAQASSVNALGTVMQDPPPEIHYLPVDEDHPLSPREPYGLGKQTMEIVGDGFGRQAGAPSSVASLRFPAVLDEATLRNEFVEGEQSEANRDDLYTYVHVADAARACRAAVETDLGGHERFWIVADDTTVDAPTAEVVDREWPDVEHRREFEDHEALVENEKAASLLDWEPVHSWREL